MISSILSWFKSGSQTTTPASSLLPSSSTSPVSSPEQADESRIQGSKYHKSGGDATFAHVDRPADPMDSNAVNVDAWMKKFLKALKTANEKPRGIRDIGRRGIPDIVRGKAWCLILQVEQVPEFLKDYKAALKAVFGTVSPTHFEPPCFGASIRIESFQLNVAQQMDFKRILTIVGHYHPNLEYTPIIPVLVGLLLGYLDADEVLGCMASLIDGHSIPASKRQDWAYFPLHRRDYLIFERVFEDLISKFVPNVAKHIGKIQKKYVNYVPDWHRLLSEIFIGIYPLELIVRIMDTYLIEGYKVLLQFALAHIVKQTSLILEASTPESIDQALFGPSKLLLALATSTSPNLGMVMTSKSHLLARTLERFFQIAFEEVHFSRSIIWRYRNRNRKLSLGDFDTEDQLLIFHRPLPQLISPSTIVKEAEWAAIWNWIPSRYRLLNLDLIFTTREHGTSLAHLYRSCGTNEPLLMIIESTIKDRVIGAYLSKSFANRSGNSFYGTGETFVFSLRPNLCQYGWDPTEGSMTRSNSIEPIATGTFISGSDQLFCMGTGPSHFALSIDTSLSKVTSAASYTFGNSASLFGIGEDIADGLVLDTELEKDSFNPNETIDPLSNSFSTSVNIQNRASASGMTSAIPIKSSPRRFAKSPIYHSGSSLGTKTGLADAKRSLSTPIPQSIVAATPLSAIITNDEIFCLEIFKFV